VWQNKFRLKVFYYETKPLPSQQTSTDISYLHHDAARLKVGDLLHWPNELQVIGQPTRFPTIL
jgi:hypothetical protein